MSEVSAVTTTGIYCRPGCGARPRAENVLRLPSSAAAESAGYRACLRCRPYRGTISVPDRSPELVCRAVRLILAGALDEGRETDLAARLGLSDRHLRRLFTAHLGVTPDGLARSSRAHFARRLLDDTDLSITDIAYAAGFGSLRQFNRVCQEIFRAPPRELRARRRSTDRLAADGGLALRLPFRGPLDWSAMVAQLGMRAIPGVEHVSGSAYRRTVVIGANPGMIELLPGGEDHLVLRVHLPHWEALIHIADRARRIANLDLDPREPVRQFGEDELLGPLVRADPGLRPAGTWDPFEAGVRAIIGHQRSDAGTNALLGKIVRRYGRPVGGLAPFGLRYTFPPPGRLATASFAGTGLAMERAHAVRSFARSVAADAIRLDRSVDLDRLIPMIAAIDGIGPITAHDIALRIGEPDAWPVTPRAFDRMLAGCPRAAGAVADRWRPWRALAATHLWRTTDDPAAHPSLGDH